MGEKGLKGLKGETGAEVGSHFHNKCRVTTEQYHLVTSGVCFTSVSYTSVILCVGNERKKR